MASRSIGYWVASAAVLAAGLGFAGLNAFGPSEPAAIERAPAGEAPHVEQPSIRFGVAEAPPKPAGAIRLTTLNLQNLYRDAPGETPDPERKPAKPEAQLKAAGDLLRKLDADVLALQEVESEAVLTWFRDTYLGGLGYDHVASVDAGDDRGIEQSVLSRFPIEGVRNWPGLVLEGKHPLTSRDPEARPGEEIRFRRSPLRAQVVVPAERAGGSPYRLTLFVVHHKSGRDAGYWREAEGKATARLAKEELAGDPDGKVVILGDFNATMVDMSFRAYLDAGFADAQADRAVGNPAWATHESGRTIDYVLVSPGLRAGLVGSGFVLGAPARPAGVDWRTYPAPAGYVSDHYAVAIDLVPKP
ncbi:MAG: endonuclease/exonuclease/phosphatase family protein [Phycisphaerae bacterium]|nr:endonuclease/exonuclease/phosphatase family protein [Phycisphaerae bacterium]